MTSYIKSIRSKTELTINKLELAQSKAYSKLGPIENTDIAKSFEKGDMSANEAFKRFIMLGYSIETIDMYADGLLQ